MGGYPPLLLRKPGSVVELVVLPSCRTLCAEVAVRESMITGNYLMYGGGGVEWSPRILVQRRLLVLVYLHYAVREARAQVPALGIQRLPIATTPLMCNVSTWGF